jgi:hypothetical protein
MVDFFYNFSGLTFSMVDFLQATLITTPLILFGSITVLIFDIINVLILDLRTVLDFRDYSLSLYYTKMCFKILCVQIV